MDHRGTGWSIRLDCVAAQAMTSGSPRGQNIVPMEVPSCAKDLHFKYGDLSAFSITSAASDVSTFISDYTNGANTFVYGVSYGTALVERLMHLNTPSVKGYILDSVVPTSGAPTDKFHYFSKLDTDAGQVGEYFMGLCGLDAQCKARFPAGNLSSALRDLIEKFDTDKNSTCASLVNRDEPDLPPSYMLRFTLGTLMGDASTRTLIPPIVYRLGRCNAKDVEVMTQVFKSVQTASTSANEDTHFSFLLYYLIVYSEYWETPAPSRAEMESRMNGSSIVTRATFRQALPLYCAMSKEKSAACDEFNYGSYDADALSYRRDQYWNKSASLVSF